MKSYCVSASCGFFLQERVFFWRNYVAFLRNSVSAMASSYIVVSYHWYGEVWCEVWYAKCGEVWYVKCGEVWYGMIKRGGRWYGKVWWAMVSIVPHIKLSPLKPAGSNPMSLQQCP